MKTRSPKKKNRFRQLMTLLALASLLAAYVAGNLQNRDDTINILQRLLPGKEITKTSPGVFEVKDQSHKAISWVAVTEHQGWGGPLIAGTLINEQAEVEQVLVLKHRETPAFFQSLVDQGYFDQYKGMPLQSAFHLESDIDGVSSATISSNAVANAVREGAHRWAKEYFSLEVLPLSSDVRIDANGYILIVMYAVILIGFFKKIRKLRYVTLAFGVGFIGFHLAMPISISAFGGLLLGYLPSFSKFFFWWLLVAGAVLMAVVCKKNLYCYWACPFGGIQEFISLIGGVRIKVSPNVARVARKLVYFFFWLSFMIMFATGNPALGTFEPFTVLFSFKGLGVQWYLVTVAIAGSFIIPRFWCRFFCPVGLMLNTLAKTRKKTNAFSGHLFKSKKKSYDKKAIQ